MSPRSRASQERRAKLLVVDDDEVCLAVTRESLEPDGFDVIELENPPGMSGIVNSEKPNAARAAS